MKIFNNKYFLAAIVLVAGIIIGWIIKPSSKASSQMADHQHASAAEVWTCSMHPSVRQSEPGKCPICGMDLIPLESDDDGTDPSVKMSETAIRLANIQTTRVGSQVATKEIRLNGKVMPDERRISAQVAHIPGRIEQLAVNFTGEQVAKGQLVAKVYSPELVTAQRELVEAQKIKNLHPELFSAAKEKLRNWKLSDRQIDEILQLEKPIEKFPLIADVSGIVMARKVSVGDYVMTGMPLYEVVDLSRVWVLFDVYENDMPWVKRGSTIEFTVQSLPGEKFTGTVQFIDPTIDPMTRVATARVEIGNPQMRLKPEMFANGIVKSQLNKTQQMVVPKSAVMWTGERSVVYRKQTSDEGVSFVMHEVVLGPSLGDGYVIKAGIELGMEIVTNGTFTIDAAAQLAGKPSMMKPSGGHSSTGHDHGSMKLEQSSGSEKTAAVNPKFAAQLTAMLPSYLKLKDALVAANAGEAAAAAKDLSNSLKQVDMKLLVNAAHEQWMPLHKTLSGSAAGAASNESIEDQRKAFSQITYAYFRAIQNFNITGLHAYYQYCPMAFNNQGAYWISSEKEIKNPYFGSKMMKCGETKQELH
ncbi:MAG: efflux RND transporter periplasmic adaptor subunit [Cyclobacteriaceae bacterium]